MNRKFFLFFALAFLGFSPCISHAADDVETLITWQAQNLYPATYEGKAYPVSNTPLAMSAIIKKGKDMLDLSSSEYTWYADDRLIASGAGKSKITFSPRYSQGEYVFVEVRIKLDADGLRKTGKTTDDPIIQKTFRLYLKEPVVALELPFYDKYVSPGKEILLKAFPYFFNAESLDSIMFWWQVAGITKNGLGGNTVPLIPANVSGSNSLMITTTAQNMKQEDQYAQTKTTIKLLPQ